MKKQETKIRIGTEWNAQVLFEREVSVNGWGGLVIYGKHVNGYFCCVPGEYGVEMSEPTDTFYNTEKLMHAGAPEWLARGIASAIKYISEQREEMRREGARA